MLHRLNPSREIRFALGLGVLSLLTNIISQWLVGSHALRLGNTFLIISAQLGGLHWAFVSFAAAVIPETMWSGEHLYTLRMLVIVSLCGYAVDRGLRVPSFAVTLLSWAVLLGPGFYWLSHQGYIAEGWDIKELSLYALNDFSAALLAGAIALHPSVWSNLRELPRQTSPATVLLYSFFLVGTAVLYLTSTILSHTPQWGVLLGLTSVATLSSIASAIMGKIIWPDSPSALPPGLMSSTSKLFSGRTSEYWRREKAIADTATKSAEIQSVSTKGESKSAPESALCALSRSGTILFVNPLFRELAQVRQNDILGRDIRTVTMHPSIQQHLLEVLKHTIEKGPVTVEVKLNSLPERLCFLELSTLFSDSQPSPESQPENVLITMRDITERRTLSSSVMREQRLGSLGALVAGIGHTFNNVLTAISVRASFASHTPDQAKIREALAQIVKTAQDAGTLVHQLLKFADGRAAHMEVHDLSKALQERIDLLRQAVGEQLELKLEAGSQALPALCDRNLVLQALTNLLINARQAYRGQPGMVSITIDTEHLDEEVTHLQAGGRPGEFVRIRVRDTGVGMTPETLANVFRIHSTPLGESTHTGLGLWTVFTIVRAHDGFLTAESRPGKGTTVSMYLPLHQESKDKHSDSMVLSSPNDAENLTFRDLQGQHEDILVVEDDDNIRQVVSSMLASLGYQVSSCSNGQEALQRCQESDFDLLLVDLVMPRMDGLQVISKAKSVRPELKFVVMNGYGGLPEGADQAAPVIAKPFDIETLARAIRDSLTH